jgi:3',5'-cyclic AMP phosphodiesterase CpdA
MTVVAHLSDPHLGATWAGGDPDGQLAAAVEAIRSLGLALDAVLVTGDLADHAADAEYMRVKELVSALGAPVLVLPGNHDDRAALRAAFDLPGAGAEPVQHCADAGALRLVMLDTTRPGEDPGALDEQRLAWLEAELAAAPDRPTLVAMHHPPLATGLPAWDALGLSVEDRNALAAVIERHPQVRRLVAGHHHRTMLAALAGRPVLVVPSTYVQGRPDFATQRAVDTAEPPGFALHRLVDGDVVSTVHAVG